jgi:signal transduction histidine kinase/streptogramin lyase
VSLALVGVCLGATTSALDGARPMSHYIRDQWGSDKGFPGGPVYAITQSADGYLWIAAEKGLVRFDGLAFRLLEPRGTTTSAGPTVLGVAAAADGSVWARLRGQALVRYHRGTFADILSSTGPPESVVSAMARGRGDTMLLATLARGALAVRDGRFDPVAPAAALGSFVIAMAEARDRSFWLGTRDAGLLRVQGGNVQRITKGLPDLKVNCLFAVDDGGLWVGTDKGVARWNGIEMTRAGIPAALHELPALAMIRDRTANLWIAAGRSGLVRLTSEGVATVDSDERSDRYVSAVFEDRDGNLWIGTDRGIERWRDPVFAPYSGSGGLPSGGSGPIYVDPSGRVWFAPVSGGLGWLRDGIVRTVSQAGLDRDIVYSIDGAADDVWVGRQRGGVTRLRTSAAGIQIERFTKADGLAEDSVYAVMYASDGAVWAGTLSGGATRIKNREFTTYTKANGLASNSVSAIVEGSDGTIWFATPDGLSALSRGGWRSYTKRDGLPSNDVSTLSFDRGGHLWIGTAGGLALFKEGEIRAFAAGPSALHAPVLGLALDRNAFLWVNAADRVLRVNRDALLHARLHDDDVRQFGVADGLLGVESVKRHRTIVADSGGRIWLATRRGISVADPELAEGRAQPALTTIETMSADGAPMDVQRPISIPTSRRRIAFGYTGLSLAIPERVLYRYRLDGFDADWSEPVASRQVEYTNLGAGDYRFRVIASNSDGRWTGPEATLSFTVQPLFWQKGSFQALAVLLLALAGWGLYRLRMLQLARQLNVRFEERLTERTRIAQELHDTLLQGFVSASMQLHVAADRLPDDSPAKAPIGRVLDLMARVMDEGRNAVRGLRASSTAPKDLEQAFSGIQQELAPGAEAAYRVIVEGRPRPLNPAVRDEVYRIGREGLVNAFRHAKATNVEIELEYRPKELRLFVRDDGRGIDPEAARSAIDGHWGITGMRERAERIGGTLKIRSRSAAGTEVELRVPGRAAFHRETAATTEKHL